MPKINAATIDEHKEKTRAALLEAGATAFQVYGLAGTSIGALADEAGIARTTVYEYFPNKDAVLAELIYERFPPIAERILDDLPSDPLQRSMMFVREYPVVTTLLFKVSRELPKPERDAVWSVVHPIRDEVREQCRKLVASGQLPGVDPGSLGMTIADHVIGGIDELSERGEEHAEVIIATRVGFLRRGLGVTD